MRLWQLIESTGNGNMIHIGPPDDYMDDVWKHEVYINGKMVTSGEHFELDGKRFDSVDQFIVALSKEYNVPAEFDLYMLDDDGENPTLSSPGFTPRSSMTNEEEDPYASQTIMDEDPPLGINYDYANLPKVDWDKYSTKAIKEFLSVIENLDFESGYYGDADDFDDMHFNATQWIEKNVLAKRQDKSVTGVKESTEMMTEAQFDEAAGEKDACYHKVKSRYKVWPSAYASGALVQCRKKGAKNWGNSKN